MIAMDNDNSGALLAEQESGGPHGQIERTLAVMELLTLHAEGQGLFEIADHLQIPRSATHRILTILVARGYVRQDRYHGAYRLTAKIASLGFTFLARAGVTDLAQPILDRLARDSGELVRLAMVDDQSLTWVAKAQGSPYGLRYDPEMGQVARLSCSASGMAWLLCLSDEDALARVEAQGFGMPADYGPRAPRTPASFLKLLRHARKQGYSEMVQTFAPGMAAIAAPIRHAVTFDVMGTVSIAGPHLRFTEDRMRQVVPALLDAAKELSSATIASPWVWSGRRQDIFNTAPESSQTARQSGTVGSSKARSGQGA
jgi:IclR family acetate operon transcriptional repressor